MLPKQEVVRELLTRSIIKSEGTSKGMDKEYSPRRGETVSQFEVTSSQARKYRETPMKQDDEEELIRYFKE